MGDTVDDIITTGGPVKSSTAGSGSSSNNAEYAKGDADIPPQTSAESEKALPLCDSPVSFANDVQQQSSVRQTIDASSFSTGVSSLDVETAGTLAVNMAGIATASVADENQGALQGSVQCPSHDEALTDHTETHTGTETSPSKSVDHSLNQTCDPTEDLKDDSHLPPISEYHQETADDVTEKYEESVTAADPGSEMDENSCKDVTGALQGSVDPPCSLSYTIPVFGQDSSLGRRASERAASWMRGQKTSSAEYSESDVTSAGSSTLNDKSEAPASEAPNQTANLEQKLTDPCEVPTDCGGELEDPNNVPTTDTDLLNQTSSINQATAADAKDSCWSMPTNTFDGRANDTEAPSPDHQLTSSAAQEVPNKNMPIEAVKPLSKSPSPRRELEGASRAYQCPGPHPSRIFRADSVQIVVSTRAGIATMVNAEEVGHNQPAELMEEGSHTAVEASAVGYEEPTKDTAQAGGNIGDVSPLDNHLDNHTQLPENFQKSTIAENLDDCLQPNVKASNSAELQSEGTLSLQNTSTGHDATSESSSSCSAASTFTSSLVKNVEAADCIEGSSHSAGEKSGSLGVDEDCDRSESSSSTVVDETETVTESSYATTSENERYPGNISLVLTVPTPSSNKNQGNSGMSDRAACASISPDSSDDDDDEESVTETFSGTYTYSTTFSSKAMSHLPLETSHHGQESDDTSTSVAQDGVGRLGQSSRPLTLPQNSLTRQSGPESRFQESGGDSKESGLSKLSLQLPLEEVARESDEEDGDAEKSVGETTYPFSPHKQSLSNMESATVSHLTLPAMATCRAELNAAREKFFLGPDIPPEGAVSGVSAPPDGTVETEPIVDFTTDGVYSTENVTRSFADQSTGQMTMSQSDELTEFDASESVAADSYQQGNRIPMQSSEKLDDSKHQMPVAEIHKKVSFSDVLVTKPKRKKHQTMPLIPKASNIKGILKPPSRGTNSPAVRRLSGSNSTDSLGWGAMNGGHLIRNMKSKPPAPIDPESLRSESLDMLHKRKRGFFARLFRFGSPKAKKKVAKSSGYDHEHAESSSGTLVSKTPPAPAKEKRESKKPGFFKRIFGKKKKRESRTKESEESSQKMLRRSDSPCKFVNIEVHQNFIELPTASPAQMGEFRDAGNAHYTWPRRLTVGPQAMLPNLRPSIGAQTLPAHLRNYRPIERSVSGANKPEIDFDEPEDFRERAAFFLRGESADGNMDGDIPSMMHSSMRMASIEQVRPGGISDLPGDDFRIPPGVVLGEDFAAGEPPTGMGQWPGEPWVNYPVNFQRRRYPSTDSMRPEVGSYPQTIGSTSCSSSVGSSASSYSPSLRGDLELLNGWGNQGSQDSSEPGKDAKLTKRSSFGPGFLLRRLSLRSRRKNPQPADPQEERRGLVLCTCSTSGSPNHPATCQMMAGLEPSQITVDLNRMRAGNK